MELAHNAFAHNPNNFPASVAHDKDGSMKCVTAVAFFAVSLSPPLSVTLAQSQALINSFFSLLLYYYSI